MSQVINLSLPCHPLRGAVIGEASPQHIPSARHRRYLLYVNLWIQVISIVTIANRSAHLSSLVVGGGFANVSTN